MTSYLSIDLIELDEVEHAHGARTRKTSVVQHYSHFEVEFSWNITYKLSIWSNWRTLVNNLYPITHFSIYNQHKNSTEPFNVYIYIATYLSLFIRFDDRFMVRTILLPKCSINNSTKLNIYIIDPILRHWHTNIKKKKTTGYSFRHLFFLLLLVIRTVKDFSLDWTRSESK